jgi:DNA mismatch endonuclease, patch repair protein
MSRIRSKDTKPELVVRSILHRLGYRFRVHVARLPGRPDIVLAKWRTVLFVNGCFWHRHGCKFSYNPKTRRKFWERKFLQNVRRDRQVVEELTTLGWRVATVWECQTGDLERLGPLLKKLIS